MHLESRWSDSAQGLRLATVGQLNLPCSESSPDTAGSPARSSILRIPAAASVSARTDISLRSTPLGAGSRRITLRYDPEALSTRFIPSLNATAAIMRNTTKAASPDYLKHSGWVPNMPLRRAKKWQHSQILIRFLNKATIGFRAETNAGQTEASRPRYQSDQQSIGRHIKAWA